MANCLLAGCSAIPCTSVEVTRLVEVTRQIEVTRMIESTVILNPVEPTAELTNTAAPVNPADARSSKYIDGNASPDLPAGEIGIITVIATGKYSGSSIPVIVRNNTTDIVIRGKVTGVVKSSADSLLATGGDQGFKPNVVKPGEIALGYVYFGIDINLPDDAKFEFEATATPMTPDSTKYENIRDLEVSESNLVGKRIVGILINAYKETVSGPISIYAFCFDNQGAILSQTQAFADKDQAAYNESIPFQVGLGNNSCPVYLVAGSGYADL
jgi:hypothetical protein